MTANTFFRPDRRASVVLLPFIFILFWCIPPAKAMSPSPLFARGYTVIPEPQKVELSAGDFVFGNGWRLVLDSGVRRDGAALEILRDDLASRYGIHLETSPRSGSVLKTLRLTISPDSLKIGFATDRDRDKVAEEAYRLDLSPQSIPIAANAAPGLLYGAETLVQLVKFYNGANWLPAGRINACLANNAQCNEADETKKLGGVGMVLADFTPKAAGYLHDHGRTVIFWGEYPLKPNLEMLQDLNATSASIHSAETAAANLNFSAALSSLDHALQLADVIRAQRNRALQNATSVWYKTWYPRVPEANGRRYLLVLNSVQDYRVDRTLGLNYLIQREVLLPFEEWFMKLQQVRNHYATAHQLPETALTFDWQDDASTSLGSSY